MWKWTKSNEIKVFILDAFSLSDEYLNYNYLNFLPDLKIYKVKPEQLMKKEDYDFGIYPYIDVSSLIQRILDIENCESYSVVCISQNSVFLKEMIQNHIGTVHIGNIEKYDLRCLPDFNIYSINGLEKIFKQINLGYAAEVLACNKGNYGRKSLCQCQYTIKGEDKIVNLYMGGRYYSKKHNFILDDPLSKTVQNFKNRYIPSVDEFFDNAITNILKFEKIDYITYVPLKPQEIKDKRFNRFVSLNLIKSKKLNLNLENIIECVKDFTQKGNDYLTRKENVRGKYKVRENYDIKNKTVLFIDDVYASGSTVDEITRILYEAGAKNVIALVLSVNQLVESSSVSFHKISCSLCGSNMSLKYNNADKILFFGCDKYRQHIINNTSLSISVGLEKLKSINKLERKIESDLNDEY
ncbi:ComF family protein [Faecalicoccus pleomorphus]|uniref:ComF family protein n=1 Tax=Faecalicoccus pleomorphus TaxID=1323 RepID=UPI001960D61A|nr:phosphoribosyltransferase family protein [Faecalicoccus pleomorphus]MBM6765754.1 ComF family protein [Faecalicoccus pleomorphus]MDM8291995.1 phosphoribosyltransferase family protein [Faecalicoccus pleomorphus]